jgi:hypothetical protein
MISMSLFFVHMFIHHYQKINAMLHYIQVRDINIFIWRNFYIAQKTRATKAKARAVSLGVVWPALLASVSDADESLFDVEELVGCDPRVEDAPELRVLLPVFEACTSLTPPDPAVKVTPSISKAEPPAEAVWVVVPSTMIQAPLESCEYVTIWPLIVVVVALMSTSPFEPAVKVTPSISNAEPPAEAVCVVVPSGMIQAPLESCEYVTIWPPIVVVVACISTSPSGPAVRVAASTSTADPLWEIV